MMASRRTCAGRVDDRGSIIDAGLSGGLGPPIDSDGYPDRRKTIADRGRPQPAEGPEPEGEAPPFQSPDDSRATDTVAWL